MASPQPSHSLFCFLGLLDYMQFCCQTKCKFQFNNQAPNGLAKHE